MHLNLAEGGWAPKSVLVRHVDVRLVFRGGDRLHPHRLCGKPDVYVIRPYIPRRQGPRAYHPVDADVYTGENDRAVRDAHVVRDHRRDASHFVDLVDGMRVTEHGGVVRNRYPVSDRNASPISRL